MEARRFIERLFDGKKETEAVTASDLDMLVCQEGTPCDCKGCDN